MQKYGPLPGVQYAFTVVCYKIIVFYRDKPYNNILTI